MERSFVWVSPPELPKMLVGDAKGIIWPKFSLVATFQPTLIDPALHGLLAATDQCCQLPFVESIPDPDTCLIQTL
jgi:hypothetical protein